MKSQNKQVLDYMKNHGSITPLEALNHIGCMRLSARIWDLRKEGYNINTEQIKVKSRAGSAVVACYSLEE